jgi:hypothetical protein
MIEALLAALITFVALFVAVPLILGLLRPFGLYTIVHEKRCHEYLLFGQIVCTLDEPGLHFLLAKIGWRAFVVNWLGTCHVLDMRLDQEYLRGQPVNSEEGAPMGIGIWYEMFVSDPIAYLFTVRAEVSPQSHEWGYRLGSIYIRKVHFRDSGMIKQIESKVVNRLRQVTSAIKQEGANQVNIITSTAERTAAIEFAKAAAIRPEIVAATLERVSREPELAAAMFEILEAQQIIEGSARVALLPRGGNMLGQLLASFSPAPSNDRPPPSNDRKS